MSLPAHIAKAVPNGGRGLSAKQEVVVNYAPQTTVPITQIPLLRVIDDNYVIVSVQIAWNTVALHSAVASFGYQLKTFNNAGVDQSKDLGAVSAAVLLVAGQYLALTITANQDIALGNVLSLAITDAAGLTADCTGLTVQIVYRRTL